ncbi:MAG: tetratricopeptide repeat protein [Myxococcales bacterium]
MLAASGASHPVGASPRARAPRTAVAAPGCPPGEPVPGPGIADPFHVPAPAAAQLNADGKILYRQGRWDEARQKYRAAEALDPDFQAPALNVACSFVRQERFGEAVREVVRLIDHAYLPWSEEVLAAADLGALKIRPEGKQVRAALDAARLRWAEGLQNDVIVVARLRPALKLDLGAKADATPQGGAPAANQGPSREQALVLGQRQEVFAWSPRTRRYRQLTSQEGRVLAAARSSDGRRLTVVTAQKLIRVQGDEGEVALRGVAIDEVDLGTLVPVGRGVVSGDVRSLAILPMGAGFAYRIDVGPGNVTSFVLTATGLDSRRVPRSARPLALLSGRGVVSPRSDVVLSDGCAGFAGDLRVAGRPPDVLIRGPGRKPSFELHIGGPHGAALVGLPIP